MKLKHRYLITKRGAGGAAHYYWQPSAELRAAGFKLRRLSDVRAIAIAEAERINAEVDRWRSGEAAGTGDADPTFAGVAAAWQGSRLWTDLAASTRRQYRLWLPLLERWAGPVRLAAIERHQINTLYESLLATGKTPRANAIMRTLQALYRYAAWAGVIPEADNHCRRLGLKGTPRRPWVWSRAAVDAFVAAADAAGRHSLGTAVLLNEWCGQRQGDVLAWQRPDEGGRLRYRQSKTAAAVVLPLDVVPHLAERAAAEIARQRARGIESPFLILSEETGRPYRADNVRHVFARIRGEAAAAARTAGDPELAAELAKVDFMHLRHTAVTRLAEAGVDHSRIAAITGHSLTRVGQILEHYLARTELLAVEAFQTRKG